LAQFLKHQQVEIIASLPCYLEKNVDLQRGQRGKGAFQDSITGLRQLNDLGYGQKGSGLVLNLVFNPQGANLPAPQGNLEMDYKQFLKKHDGIVFNQLYTLCNMPIQQLLQNAHRDENLETVMCRHLISIDWQGYVYDCDFNQMLELPLYWHIQKRRHISELINAELKNNPIVVAGHCYGCTAGQGSSCGGALS